MKVVAGKNYKINGESKYFKDKYGTSNPIIRIEDRDTVIWPNGGWGLQNGNPTSMLYGIRAGFEDLPTTGVWYGHVGEKGLAELVHESELSPA